MYQYARLLDWLQQLVQSDPYTSPIVVTLQPVYTVTMNPQIHRKNALQNFRKARNKAMRTMFQSMITGRDSRLVPFDVIRDELRLLNPVYRGVQSIRLEEIVGSIGRYDDFTREFLPLKDATKERWVGVEALASTQQGWPPIDVYKVGNVYFIKDGNHRTAVARQMGNSLIEAHVWAYPETVEIDPDAELDEILIGLGRQQFNLRTEIDTVVPGHGIAFTSAGRYQELIAQIEALRSKLTIIDETETTFEQAVPLWYDLIYMPTVQIIREANLLEKFPGRTEADLFAWLSMHRDQLGDRYGQFDSLSDLAQSLIDQYAEDGIQRVSRTVRNLLTGGNDQLPPLTE